MKDWKNRFKKKVKLQHSLFAFVLCIILSCINVFGLLAAEPTENWKTENTLETVSMEGEQDINESIMEFEEEKETVEIAKPTEPTETTKQVETEDKVETTEYVPENFLGEVKEVSTWDQFTAALQDANVSTISVTDNLARGTSNSNPGTIARDLIILGNGHVIDFGTTTGTLHIILGNVAVPTTLVVDDVTLIKTSGNNVFYQGTAADTVNWNIRLQNVKTGSGTNQRGLVEAPRASVIVSGVENEWIVGSVNDISHLYVGRFEMEDGAVLNAKTSEAAGSTSNPVIRIGDSNAVSGSVVVGEEASLTIVNNGTSYGNNAMTASNGISGFIVTTQIKSKATLNITTYNYGFLTTDTSSSPTFNMENGSVFQGESQRGGTFRMGEIASSTPSSGYYCTVNIGDASGGATMNLLSHSSYSSAAEHTHNCISVNGNNSVINLKSGSVIDAVNDYDTAFIVRGENNIFTVEKDAKLNLVSNGTTFNYCSTLRFYISGYQTFDIKGGKVNIMKAKRASGNTDNPPAIRMYGDSNEVNVSDGGELSIYNEGNGDPNNGSGATVNGNQGIHYTTGNNSRPASFTLRDPGSKVEIISNLGPAIASSNQLQVKAEDGTVFVLRGRTASASSGALNVSSGALLFEMDSPLYFDFRNDCTNTASNPSGGPAINGGNSSSEFISKNSDLAVWKRTAGSTAAQRPIINMDGTPTANWTLFDYTMQGAALQYIANTSIPDKFYNSSTGPTNNPTNITGTYLRTEYYSRMSANNARAIIDEIRVPTNADKYIYGHACVPEGLREMRDAWTDEVYVTVRVKDVSGNVVFEKEGVTIGIDDEHPDGVSVYGESPRGGIFKILYDPDEDGKGTYLPIGYTIEVVSAYRSSAGDITIVGTDGVHHSEPEDLQAATVTVRDVIPPKALIIDDLDNLETLQIPIQTTVVSGTSADVGATVYLYKNGILWTNGEGIPVTGMVAADGKWSVTLPAALQENDLLAIALNDNQSHPTDLTESDTTILTQAGVFTNDGNENPAATLPFHDAVLDKRLELTAVWTELCPFILDVSVNKLTNAKGDEVTAGVIYSGNTITLKPEAFSECGSEHVHELIVIGQADTKTVFLEGSDSVPYNVYVKGITVKQMTTQNKGKVNFGANGTNLDNYFKNTNASALIIGSNVTEITVISGSSVTAYANADVKPISIEGEKARVLDLIMNETHDSDIFLEIAGEDRTLSATAARIAVMDNLTGNWLSGNVEVKDPDSRRNYVRGFSAQISEGIWDDDEDDEFSDSNHYGKTFALDKKNDTYGIYQAVRLPIPEKCLSVSVPVRIRFGMQLDGEAGDRGNTNWSAIPGMITNNSFSFEDVTFSSVDKRFGMKANAARFYYNGLVVSAQEDAENGYELKNYAEVRSVANIAEDKPKVALLGNTTVPASIQVELDEDEILDVPKDWFTMPPGTVETGNFDVTAFTAQLYLSRPESGGIPVNDYYQYPTDRSKSLTGIHHLKLVIKYLE